MIALDLSKQHTFNVDPKAKQKNDFTENLERVGNATIFFIIREVKETILDFSRGSVKVMQIRSANLFWC